MRGELGVVDRPLGQLPAQHGRPVAAGLEHGLVLAEGGAPRVQRGELARGNVDDPASGGQRERLAGRKQVLVEGERGH